MMFFSYIVEGQHYLVTWSLFGHLEPFVVTLCELILMKLWMRLMVIFMARAVIKKRVYVPSQVFIL